MALCEMCGKESSLVEADVEGIELNVCSGCIKYGTVKKKKEMPVGRSFYSSPVRKADPEFKTVENYSQLIRSARERRGLKQEDFAKFLNAKESLVAKWESGLMKPSIDVARRLEKVLGVTLVENEVVGTFQKKARKSSEGFTLGDFIKVRNRR